MKKVITLLSICLFIVNIALGLILTHFNTFNVVLSCVSIILTTFFLFAVNIIHLKDGYRSSFMFLFTLFGIIQYVLSVLSSNQFKDNWYLIGIIMIAVIEIILLIVSNTVSKKTTN